jgi:hypothetical protein
MHCCVDVSFLCECVMLCIASRLLCVTPLDRFTLVYYIFMLLPWYLSCLCLQRALTVYVYSLVWGSVELMFHCIIDYIMLGFGLPVFHFVLILRICMLTLLSQIPIYIYITYKGFSVTNNNGFWIRWLDLLALFLQLQAIMTAYNQWLSTTRFILCWTRSLFSSTVTNDERRTTNHCSHIELPWTTSVWRMLLNSRMNSLL